MVYEQFAHRSSIRASPPEYSVAELNVVVELLLVFALQPGHFEKRVKIAP